MRVGCGRWLPLWGQFLQTDLLLLSGGQFLQTDPIRYDDGPNVYAYVHGDPINGADPSGTDSCDSVSSYWQGQFCDLESAGLSTTYFISLPTPGLNYMTGLQVAALTGQVGDAVSTGASAPSNSGTNPEIDQAGTSQAMLSGAAVAAVSYSGGSTSCGDGCTNSETVWVIPGSNYTVADVGQWAALQAAMLNADRANAPFAAGALASVGVLAISELGAAVGPVSRSLGPSGNIFGRARLGGSSLFRINANNALRIGWRWRGSAVDGQSMFGISGDILDFITGMAGSHVDLFSIGRP